MKTVDSDSDDNIEHLQYKVYRKGRDAAVWVQGCPLADSHFTQAALGGGPGTMFQIGAHVYCQLSTLLHGVPLRARWGGIVLLQTLKSP